MADLWRQRRGWGRRWCRWPFWGSWRCGPSRWGPPGTRGWTGTQCPRTQRSSSGLQCRQQINPVYKNRTQFVTDTNYMFTIFNTRISMRSSRVVRAFDCKCQSRFDPSMLRRSGIWGAADEAVLNNVHKKKKKKNTTEEVSYLLLKKTIKLL